MQFFHWYIAPDGKLWNELAREAESLAALGVTAVWLPPTYKGNAGMEDVGYAVYDMFDLVEFDQKGTVRTKYGSKEELVNAVKHCQRLGLQVYADVVFNHRIGGDEEESFLATPVKQDRRPQRHWLDSINFRRPEGVGGSNEQLASRRQKNASACHLPKLQGFDGANFGICNDR